MGWDLLRMGSLGASLSIALASPAHAQAPDIAAFAECRATPLDFRTFAFSMVEDPNAHGLSPIEGDNPFLSEFRLPAPVSVFGHAADRIALTSDGILAVLPDVDADALARAQGIADQAPGAKVLGDKLLSETVEKDEDGRPFATTRILLNVSTVDTHPGAALIGCSYRTEVADEG